MTDYQKFQLQWMIDHSWSIDDLIKELDFRQENNESITEVYEDWEMNAGFGAGSIWPCEEEWEQCGRC